MSENICLSCKGLLVLALALLAALPAFGQIQATCPAPGTTAIITWTDNTTPSVYVRVEPNPDNKQEPHKFPAPGFDITKDQIGPVTIGTATFSAMSPGPWLAYYFQNEPYVQSKTVKTFTCAAPIVGPTLPPPTTPPVVTIPPTQPPPGDTVLPRLIVSVQTLDKQLDGTWRIHGDPPLTSLFLLISVNGLTAAEDEYSVEFAPGPKSVSGNPVIITALKPWAGKVEVRWWAHYTGQ